MKFIQVLPFTQWLPLKTDESDEVDFITIKLLDNQEILSIEPLYKILNKLKNAK